MNNVPIIWILGGPGCGKGTQCERIVQKYHFEHLSTGDLLRAEVSSGSEKGRELAEIMKEGKLVSNDAVLGLLEQAIRSKLGSAKGFLIDGYPREKDQVSAFERKIGPADLILYFECAEETMFNRIMARAEASTEKRADDNADTIKTRLATFKTNTGQILKLCANKTVTINAERAVADIFNDVVCCIDALLQRKANSAACAR